MAPRLVSEDGRWWWDGAQWRSRVVEGDLDLFWFTTSPDWFTRVLVVGLIGLIPFAGAMNLFGWTLATSDMLRQRWRELPPAGFEYLGRGVAPFVVSLVYALLGLFVFGGLIAVAVGIWFSDHSQLPIAIAIGGLGLMLMFGWWLLMLFLYPAILVGADRLGITRALDPRTLWRISRANGGLTLKISAIYFVGVFTLTVIGSTVGAVVPLGSLLVSVALPAVLAMIAPSIAMMVIEPDTKARDAAV
ncbi:MAG TPA: DUF4013 domain-containing protein [Candidatus Dormibacteraeota bacterium]|nr:DUF4013 domain-containing protein [Candidatus Dormibacteraeota bacterium]